MNIFKTIEIIEKNNEIYKMLKDCPYEILKKWEIKSYKKGSIMLNQGEIYDKFYILIDGIADIFIMSENGKRYSQAVYNKGNYIGELEIFDRIPFSCSVEALTDIYTLELERDYFLIWIEKDRNINEYITRTLCTQFYELSRKSAQDTLYSLKQRLCKYLLDSVDDFKYKKDNIEINIEKSKLSNQLAVTQRSINRVLSKLKDKNIIDIDSNVVVIKNLDKLKEEEKLSRYE